MWHSMNSASCFIRWSWHIYEASFRFVFYSLVLCFWYVRSRSMVDFLLKFCVVCSGLNIVFWSLSAGCENMNLCMEEWLETGAMEFWKAFLWKRCVVCVVQWPWICRMFCWLGTKWCFAASAWRAYLKYLLDKCARICIPVSWMHETSSKTLLFRWLLAWYSSLEGDVVLLFSNVHGYLATCCKC